MDRRTIREAIIVEGRDDAIEVAKAYDTLIITTHGFGIREETWKLIEKADREKGLIVLTDPDFSGEEIRRRIRERFPDAKHAYLPLSRALRDGDIGVENADTEAIVEAIEHAHSTAAGAPAHPVREQDLRALGLSGAPGSAARREAASDRLCIGYSNAKAFLKKLNAFGIGLEELEDIIQNITVQDIEKEIQQ